MDAVPVAAATARAVGGALARYLSQPRHVHGTSAPVELPALAGMLRPADVILVEGNSRFSTVVKYLTQSTWSHAALYVGDRLGTRDAQGQAQVVVEADVNEGVRAVALTEFAGLHLRVCRAVSLTEREAQAVIDHAVARLGHHYDLRNVFDLMRYLLPTPVPLRWRRRLLTLGSGDPTRAICSTLVAQAFQSVRYPILPLVEQRSANDPMCPACMDEIYHVRHHSLYAPRDFDVSPYFAVVKPTLAAGFDHHALHWADSPLTQGVAR
jgi:Permuted papain-like amidase enzyme, YaeF/YiiX, C92 family